MTPVPGRISVGNIYQVGPITYVATVGPNGQFSVSVNPGVYEVTGVSPQYVGGRQSCAIAGQTVRVRSGDRVNVSVECQIR